MTTIGHHVTIKASDGRVLAPLPTQRRRAICRVLDICRPFRLLVAHLVDSHLHLELLETERIALQIAGRIERSLSWVLSLPVPFQPANAEPIRKQTHLYNAFDYILRQQSRHGLDWDPFFDASSLLDLLGLRTVGIYTAAHVKSWLPRISRESLLARLGVPRLLEVDEPLELLQEATLAAAGLTSESPLSARARQALRAAVHVCGKRRAARALAETFRVSRKTIQRYRAEPPDALLVSAIRKQLCFRSLVERQRQLLEGRPPAEGVPASR